MRYLGLGLVLSVVFLSFAFAQNQCECADYVSALNELNKTIKDFKSDFLKMVVGLSTVLGTFAAILVGKALRRST
jgi:outer membrane lipoprotein-sorting protein